MPFGRRARLRGWAVLCAYALAQHAAPAFAASSAADKAAAEALFDRGLTLMRSGQLKEACAKLETSEHIDPAVGTLLYLGTCYERLGRTASAWATFREAGSMARSMGQNDRAQIAQSHLAQLEPELAYLTVVVPSAARVPGLIVRRAGSVLESDVYGVALPADPGEIPIEASAPGFLPSVATLTITARAHQVFTVPTLKRNPRTAAPSQRKPGSAVSLSTISNSRASKRSPVDDSGPSAGRITAYSLAGAGLVGLGVGSYFGVRAIQHNRDAKDESCSGDTCLGARGLESTNESLDAARASNIAFAAGGGLLALGVVLYVLSPSQSTPHISLSPTTTRNAAGLSLGGVFQ